MIAVCVLDHTKVVVAVGEHLGELNAVTRATSKVLQRNRETKGVAAHGEQTHSTVTRLLIRGRADSSYWDIQKYESGC